MNDEQVSAALRSLPREQATGTFTRRVLERIEEPPRRPASARWPLTAAAAVVLLATSLGVREWRHVQERRDTLARLEQLLIEKHELEAELEALRRLTADARPVVYLGGNEEVDLVVDLARFHRQGGLQPDHGLMRPAKARLEDPSPRTVPRFSRAVY